jgi:hypothetical protein
MGRVYTASFNEQAETTQVDLLEIAAGSADVVIIHEIGLGQLLESGDSEEEMLLLKLVSGNTTTGSGGGSITPTPVLPGDVASGATLKHTNTTKATGGTQVLHYSWYWNIRVPFQMVWTPETRPILIPSRRAQLELATTPADSITFGGYIVFEELG